MKQFIVLAVTLPLMLLFIVQYTQDQLNYAKIGIVNDTVYNYKEKAKQQGSFSDELISEMKKELSLALGIDESDIIVGATSESSEKGRGELIHYSIQLPIGQVMAGSSFFGIGSKQNIYTYSIDSYTTSEKLRQSP